MEQEFYTYEQFENDCKKIVRWVKKNNLKFDSIYGIPRGGLIMAVRLSHLLDIPIILDQKGIYFKTLVVDDISDTGKTLQGLADYYPETKIVTLYYHKQTKVVPNFWCREKKNKWVHYWWEK